MSVLAMGCTHAPPTGVPPAFAAPEFAYDASAPLDIAIGGPPRIWGSIEIQPLTFASPRGGRVTALVVTPAGPATPAAARPAIVLQHGMGQLDKTELLPDAVELAAAGAVAILVDAPDQRPAALRTLDYGDHQHDPELWSHATVDLRRAIDVISARADVDPTRIGYVGHSFGASQGAILAAVEPRLRAAVLIAPGDLTRGIRESTAEPMVALRKNVPPAALAAYLATMTAFDASRFLSRVPKETALLIQFGAYDTGSSERANTALVAASTARTHACTYPTGHFITSIAAVQDRVAFLARALGMQRPGDELERGGRCGD